MGRCRNPRRCSVRDRPVLAGRHPCSCPSVLNLPLLSRVKSMNYKSHACCHQSGKPKVGAPGETARTVGLRPLASREFLEDNQASCSWRSAPQTALLEPLPISSDKLSAHPVEAPQALPYAVLVSPNTFSVPLVDSNSLDNLSARDGLGELSEITCSFLGVTIGLPPALDASKDTSSANLSARVL